jgi:5-(carboxyamino)imidazole ribonucleotide synthase
MKTIPHALHPGATIGIIGGGQLGRMLAMAAARLGFETVILTPEAENCAGPVAGTVLMADYTDPDALARLASLAQVVTFEFENVPAKTLEILSGLGCQVAPGAKALAVAQDRVDEKTFLNTHGVPTVDFAPVSNLEDLAEALARIGAPALLKTRRDGYDGKGQVWIENQDRATAEAAFASLGARPCSLYLLASSLFLLETTL